MLLGSGIILIGATKGARPSPSHLLPRACWALACARVVSLVCARILRVMILPRGARFCVWPDGRSPAFAAAGRCGDRIPPRSHSGRLLRDNVVVHEGSLKTLKRFKDEVREVREGFECGMGFENYSDLQEGDMIECFELREVARMLD